MSTCASIPTVKVGDVFESLVNHQLYTVRRKGQRAVTVTDKLGRERSTTTGNLLDENKYRRVVVVP